MFSHAKSFLSSLKHTHTHTKTQHIHTHTRARNGLRVEKGESVAEWTGLTQPVCRLMAVDDEVIN